MIKMTKEEKRLVGEMGSRWLRMPDEEILSEMAILFRLAVAIVGTHQAATERKLRGE